MKRERVRIDDDWREYGSSKTKKRGRPRSPFVYRPRKTVNTSPSVTANALGPADLVFSSIMEEISTAAAAERAGWAKLEMYLADGIVPARPRVRIRIDE